MISLLTRQLPLLLLTAAVYFLAAEPSHLHWYLPSGLLFAALWLLPTRYRAALVLGGIAARTLRGHLAGGWGSVPEFVLGNVPQPLICLVGVLLLLHWRVAPPMLGTLQGMTRLLVVAVATAAVITAGNTAFMLVHPVWSPSLEYAMTVTLGDFLGILLVAPLAAWLVSPENRRGSARIPAEVLIWIVPVVITFVLLARWQDGTAVGEMLRLLLLGALVLSAMRHGWRGAALSAAAVSTAVALERPLDAWTDNTVWMQLFVAVAGSMALLLGASVDSLRRHARELEDRQVALQRAHGKQQELVREVRLASERNLRAEERARREVAHELHDEVGQTLTALQTHVKLIEPVFAQVDRIDMARRIADLTVAMRRSLGGLLETLQPVALDELGLYGAIDSGPIRAMMEDAGVDFELQLQGEARLIGQLDELVRTAVYRVVQEATTNVVRHARASRCLVRLRLGRRDEQLWLFLDIRDDGRGFPAPLRRGLGLQGMQDRYRALGGVLLIASSSAGMRLHGLLRQPLGEEPVLEGLPD